MAIQPLMDSRIPAMPSQTENGAKRGFPGEKPMVTSMLENQKPKKPFFPN